jgi:hypothetical protein
LLQTSGDIASPAARGPAGSSPGGNNGSSRQRITVVDLTTAEVLSVHLIQPAKSYWRNQMREPGRWPGSNN